MTKTSRFVVLLAAFLTSVALLQVNAEFGDFVDYGFFPAKVVLPSGQRTLEFGDFADTPDSCPYLTSCPAICVANETDCPTQCAEGLQLCETGICREDCDAETHVVENPCTCDGLLFACAKVVDEFDSCSARFRKFYNANTACLDAQDESVPMVDFSGPYFVACYAILGIVSGLVIVWCAFNAYVPVSGATTIMTTDEQEQWTLTGYQYHPVGMFVYALVILTLLGIQFLLFLLTIFYYMQQEANVPWSPVFYDEVQVLKAFEIVWMVGFVWSFAFRYPSSIRDLFLARCTLHCASFVAVTAPTKRVETAADALPGWGESIMKAIWMPFDITLKLLFSYFHHKPGHETVFCPIESDSTTGKRGFYFRMRRFVYEADEQPGSRDVDDTLGDVKNQSNGVSYEENKEDESNGITMSFRPGTIDVGNTLGDFMDQSNGLSHKEAQARLGLTGRNSIHMKRPTILGSIIGEFSKPFYLYQNFMVWSWAPYWYYYMAIVNSVVRVTGGIIVGAFQYMSDGVLYRLSSVEGTSIVVRNGEKVAIANALIVPGDVVVLEPGIVSCDMVVLKTERLVVDESALTGEANPIVKKELDPTMSKEKYDANRHKSSVLSAGTEILEVGGDEGKDLGLVLATGSFTTKGKLVTDVLSYQRHKFKFDDEVKVVLCLLIVEAAFLVGMVFRFINENQWAYAWFYAVFVLGTVIPPLLPTVFVVSVGISAKRLQAKRITCSYQEGILIAGKVNTSFFDKTGTLTKQGMDFMSLDAATIESTNKATVGMGVCHTLHKTREGKLIGNHVDTVSFEYAGGELHQEDGQPNKIEVCGRAYTVLKQYEFDSHRQTQSVVVKNESGEKTVFVKGSPEAIRAICSTGIPGNFDEAMETSAKSGIYQLAIASKDFTSENDVKDVTRDEIEAKLHFDAFLSFQNSMRDETPGVIRELLEGNVDVAMITGDSVLTGICIAKAAGMIPDGHKVLLGRKSGDGEVYWTDVDREAEEGTPTGKMLAEGVVDLAITGEAWTSLLREDPKYATSIAKYIRVFGRCNPSDKVSVVSHFVEQGKKTLMCGDGGNDCGSLKSAHVGIALSTAEASVVAPFTSLDKEITSVVEILREGRCALASAFSAYSYYIIYGQVESYLQVINAYFAITFTEWCWVFLDGIWSICMAFSLPLSSATSTLSRSRPTASLLGPRTMASVCGMLGWNFIFLVIALSVLWNEDWFQCRKWKSDDVSDVKSIGDNYETSVLFMVGGFQYICSAIALNFGYMWRANFWKNYVFVSLALVFTIMHFVVAIHPSKFSCIWRVNCDNEDAVRWVTTPYPVAISNVWNTTVMPVAFRWKLVGIMTGNVVTLCIWQYFFVNGFLSAKLRERKSYYTTDLVQQESTRDMEEIAEVEKGMRKEAELES